jgi:hypothetical protein
MMRHKLKLIVTYSQLKERTMPIPQENLKRLDEAIDRCLTKRDRDTDPKQFFESPSARNPQIAEPPTVPQDDSTRRRDLFR